MTYARPRCRFDHRASPRSHVVRTASVRRFPSIPPTARGTGGDQDIRIRNALDGTDHQRGRRHTVPR